MLTAYFFRRGDASISQYSAWLYDMQSPVSLDYGNFYNIHQANEKHVSYGTNGSKQYIIWSTFLFSWNVIIEQQWMLVCEWKCRQNI